ncbi:hypothetical protein [Silvanigrella sp.]|jgi:hypothetical protein|uniref:hypothetical protein n=1 Tax=Silvanigrella sp. TaxID=2024976 RepID=UPI0037C81DC3
MKRKFIYILMTFICFSYVRACYACPEGQHSVCEYDPNKGKSVCICKKNDSESSTNKLVWLSVSLVAK